MPRSLNLKYAYPDEIEIVAPASTAQIEESLRQAEPGSTHARYLQQLVLQAYTDTTAEEKLPGPQRLAIIFGGTAGLWMLIAVASFAAF